MPITREQIEPTLLRHLEHRIGLDHVLRRLQREHAFRGRREPGGLSLARRLLRWSTSLSGLRDRGRRNALSPGLTANRVVSDEVPAAFDGFRILHLSDLHLDGALDFVPATAAMIASLDYDICVLTGDFRSRFRDSEGLVDQMARLREQITGDAVAVLGNHDSLAMVPWMEDMGYRVLLNEAMVLRRDQDVLHVVGVDDHHLFRCADIDKAMAGLETAFVMMLNHSPEQFREAARAGVDLYLCGHTHGGQVCLPGGVPVNLNARCPRSVARGAWQFEGMQGYTSRGVGTSLADLRFNCPPEIVVHELVRESRRLTSVR